MNSPYLVIDRSGNAVDITMPDDQAKEKEAATLLSERYDPELYDHLMDKSDTYASLGSDLNTWLQDASELNDPDLEIDVITEIVKRCSRKAKDLQSRAEDAYRYERKLQGLLH